MKNSMNITSQKIESKPIPDRNCVTHHHACDCREERLLRTLRSVCEGLRRHGINGDEVAMDAYLEISEMWRELYGGEILSLKFQPKTLNCSSK
jgi:hypothetical protein